MQFITSREWAEVLSVQRLVLLREDSPNMDMHRLMTDFTERMFAGGTLDPVLGRSAPIMRGSYFEGRRPHTRGRSDLPHGVSDEPTRAFGREWLQVAVDDAAAGQPRPAWRAALMAKYHQPDAPEIYRWMAAQLAAAGQPLESSWAAAVAQGLETPPRDPGTNLSLRHVRATHLAGGSGVIQQPQPGPQSRCRPARAYYR